MRRGGRGCFAHFPLEAVRRRGKPHYGHPVFSPGKNFSKDAARGFTRSFVEFMFGGERRAPNGKSFDLRVVRRGFCETGTKRLKNAFRCCESPLPGFVKKFLPFYTVF